MTMEVLKKNSQIISARQELVTKKASSVDSAIQSLLRRLGLARDMAVGDTVKSWDLVSTLNFISQHVREDAPILDIGCYASELIVALHKLGYSNLTGVDLNPGLKHMPYQDSIRYEVSDFMRTPFSDGSFEAITSISVIEHGFNGASLLSEMSRLLRPGGYFIASFDYWAEKIDTTGIKFFGMDWKIFSKQDVCDFIEQAAGHGLTPVGELHLECQEAPINCGGKKYTFGWLVLQKK
jgi:SAM-dependent methyltransferase